MTHKIRLAKLSDFRPQATNANQHTERGMALLESSMRQDGFFDGMTATADGEIIDGSARIEKSAVVFDEDVIVLEHDGTKPIVEVRTDIQTADDPRAKRIALAANRVAQVNLKFDPTLLRSLSEELDLTPMWTKDELREALAGDGNHTPQADDPGPQIDKAEELREKWQVEPGQLWQLGEHRLLCGDSTKQEDVERVMGEEKAQLVYTDPPYGVGYDGGTTVREKLAGDTNTDLYLPTCQMAFAYSDEKAPLYIWHAGIKGIAAAAAAAAAGYEIRCELIWNKNLAQFGALSAQYKQKHEPCYYCFKRGKAPRWFGPTNEVTVWDCDRASVNEFHPTQKPVELAERALTNSSEAGDVIADWFSGSGATLIACERLGRKCRAIEISPGYVASALQRWADMTSKEPQLL